MKARSLFYLITFFCIVFSGCKKDEVDPENITGHWYVERYTVYDNGGSRNSGTYDYEPLENYEAVGLFDFNNDGTGQYTFENLVVPFTYTIADNSNNNYGNSGSFNGVSFDSKNVNSNLVYLTFDKSKITSLRSPILANYYQLDLTRYEVFTKTKGTLRFRADLNYSSTTSYLTSDNIEFILTRQ
jgi:hypothetical protein